MSQQHFNAYFFILSFILEGRVYGRYCIILPCHHSFLSILSQAFLLAVSFPYSLSVWSQMHLALFNKGANTVQWSFMLAATVLAGQQPMVNQKSRLDLVDTPHHMQNNLYYYMNVGHQNNNKVQTHSILHKFTICTHSCSIITQITLNILAPVLNSLHFGTRQHGTTLQVKADRVLFASALVSGCHLYFCATLCDLLNKKNTQNTLFTRPSTICIWFQVQG